MEATDIWRDFHTELASEIRARLAPQLRPKYIAALEPRIEMNEVFVQAAPRAIYPDVAVVRPHGDVRMGVAVLEIPPAPLIGDFVQEEFKVVAVEIRLAQSGKLITAIEILSPTNKRPNSQALAAYRRKRVERRGAEVALLEIDLLRAGERMQIRGALPDVPYFVFLNRGGTRVEIWPIALPDPLPVIPVPLEYPDADVALDLGLAPASD